MSLISTAWAMGANGQAAAQGGNPIAAFMPLILMFGIFYFLLIRPQHKKAKDHKALLDALKAGDSVVTAGGIYGTVVSVEEDIVVVDLGETKVRMGRQYIAGLTTPAKEKGKKAKKDK